MCSNNSRQNTQQFVDKNGQNQGHNTIIEGLFSLKKDCQNDFKLKSDKCDLQIVQPPFQIPDTDKFDEFPFYENHNQVLSENYPIIKDENYFSFNPKTLNIKNQETLVLKTSKGDTNNSFTLNKSSDQLNLKIMDIYVDNPQFRVHFVDHKKETGFPVDVQKSQIHFYVHLVPTQTGQIYGRVFFQVQFQLQNSSKPLQKTLIYNIQASVEENQFKLKPLYFHDIKQNEHKVIPLNIFNPYKHNILVKLVENQEGHIVFSKIQNDEDIQDDLINVDDIQMDILQQDTNDHKISLDSVQISKDKEKSIINIIPKTQKTGIYHDLIIIKCAHQVFAVPITFRVVNTLNFYKEFLDLGIIQSNSKNQPQYNHEADLYVFNPTSRPIEIQDIIIKFDQGQNCDCFSIKAYDSETDQYNCLSNIQNNNLLLKPGQQKRKIGKISIIGQPLSSNHNQYYPKRVTGQIIIQTNDTKAQQNQNSQNQNNNNNNNGENQQTILKFGFSLIKNPISYDKKAFQFYFNPDNIDLTRQSYVQGSDISIKKFKNFYEKDQQMISITSPITIQNNYFQQMMIQDINAVSPNFKLTEFSDQTQVGLNQQQQVFLLEYKRAIKEQQNVNEISYIQLFVNNQRKILPIQIMVYDKSLYCKTATGLDFSKCSTKTDDKIIDFQSVGMNEIRKKKLFLKNNNPVDIIIYSIENPVDLIKIHLIIEDIKNTDSKVTQERKVINRKGSSQQPLQIMKPGQMATFEFILNAQKELSVNQGLKFQTSCEDFEIPLKFKIIPGQIIVPSFLQFDNIFRGQIAKQDVTIKNTFPDPVHIYQIKSYDQRFTFQGEQDILIKPNETIQAFQVAFNASYISIEEKKKQDIYKQNLLSENFIQLITYRDLNIYYEQRQDWQQLVDNKGNYIKEKINLNTSVLEDVQMDIYVNLVQPMIIQQEPIQFKLSEINRITNKDIVINNPSDQTLYVQFFISDSEFPKNTYFQHLLSDDITQKGFNIPYSKLTICIPELLKYQENDFFKNLNQIFIEQKNSQNEIIQFNIYQINEDEFNIEYLSKPHENTVINYQEAKELIGEDFLKYLLQQKSLICKKGSIESTQKHLIEKEHLMLPLIELYQSKYTTIDKTDSLNNIIKNIRQSAIEIKELSFATKSIPYGNDKYVHLDPTFMQKINTFFKKLYDSIFYPFRYIKDKYKGQQNLPEKDYMFSNKNQCFFLQKSISNSVQEIPPNSKRVFQNAIIYEPVKGKSQATLFVKNSLNGLNVVQVKGEGGIAKLNLLETQIISNSDSSIKNVTKPDENQLYDLIFDIDPSEFQNNKINAIRGFVVQNTGELEFHIHQMRIANLDCSYKYFKSNYATCLSYRLQPQDKKVLEIQFSLDEEINDVHSLKNIEESLNLYTKYFYFQFKIKVNFDNLKREFLGKQKVNGNVSTLKMSLNQQFLPIYAKIGVFTTLVMFVITIYNFLSTDVIPKSSPDLIGSIYKSKLVWKLNMLPKFEEEESFLGNKIILKNYNLITQIKSNQKLYDINPIIEKVKQQKENFQKQQAILQQQQQIQQEKLEQQKLLEEQNIKKANIDMEVQQDNHTKNNINESKELKIQKQQKPTKVNKKKQRQKQKETQIKSENSSIQKKKDNSFITNENDQSSMNSSKNQSNRQLSEQNSQSNILKKDDSFTSAQQTSMNNQNQEFQKQSSQKSEQQDNSYKPRTSYQNQQQQKINTYNNQFNQQKNMTTTFSTLQGGYINLQDKNFIKNQKPIQLNKQNLLFPELNLKKPTKEKLLKDQWNTENYGVVKGTDSVIGKVDIDENDNSFNSNSQKQNNSHKQSQDMDDQSQYSQQNRKNYNNMSNSKSSNNTSQYRNNNNDIYYNNQNQKSNEQQQYYKQQQQFPHQQLIKSQSKQSTKTDVNSYYDNDNSLNKINNQKYQHQNKNDQEYDDDYISQSNSDIDDNKHLYQSQEKSPTSFKSRPKKKSTHGSEFQSSDDQMSSGESLGEEEREEHIRKAHAFGQLEENNESEKDSGNEQYNQNLDKYNTLQQKLNDYNKFEYDDDQNNYISSPIQYSKFSNSFKQNQQYIMQNVNNNDLQSSSVASEDEEIYNFFQGNKKTENRFNQNQPFTFNIPQSNSNSSSNNNSQIQRNQQLSGIQQNTNSSQKLQNTNILPQQPNVFYNINSQEFVPNAQIFQQIQDSDSDNNSSGQDSHNKLFSTQKQQKTKFNPQAKEFLPQGDINYEDQDTDSRDSLMNEFQHPPFLPNINHMQNPGMMYMQPNFYQMPNLNQQDNQFSQLIQNYNDIFQAEDEDDDQENMDNQQNYNNYDQDFNERQGGQINNNAQVYPGSKNFKHNPKTYYQPKNNHNQKMNQKLFGQQQEQQYHKSSKTNYKPGGKNLIQNEISQKVSQNQNDGNQSKSYVKFQKKKQGKKRYNVKEPSSQDEFQNGPPPGMDQK